MSRLDALNKLGMKKGNPDFDQSPCADVVLLAISAKLDDAPRDVLESLIRDLIDAQDQGSILDREALKTGKDPVRWKLNPPQRFGVGKMLARALEIYGDYRQDGVTYFVADGQAKRRVGL